MSMRLTREDKSDLIYALALAIRDRATCIDSDHPDEDADSECRNDIARFQQLRKRLAKNIGVSVGDY